MKEEDIVLEYEQLLKSGMFWEFYPDLSGNYEKDRDDFIDHKIKEILFRISISKPKPDDNNETINKLNTLKYETIQ